MVNELNTGSQANNRRYTRHKVRDPVVITLSSQGGLRRKGRKPKLVKCHVSDVSSHGVGVWTDQPLEKNGSYVLSCTTPSRKNGSIGADGVRVKVVWCDEENSNPKMLRGGLEVSSDKKTDLVQLLGYLSKQSESGTEAIFCDDKARLESANCRQRDVRIDVLMMHDLCNVAHLMQLSAARLVRECKENSINQAGLEEWALSLKASAGFVGRSLLQQSGLMPQQLRESSEDLLIDDILNDIQSIVHSMFQIRGIALNVKIFKSDLIVHGMRSELTRAILNLALNAADAASESESKWVKISCDENGGMLVFRISNAGDGIDRSILDKIFNPGFTTKAWGKGTGLGLKIVSDVIRQHNGHVEVADPSQSCFEVRLPLK